MLTPGESFLTQFEKAVDMHKKHQSAFESFNQTFTEETIEKWEEMVSTWDGDMNLPNPYEEPPAGMFQTILNLRLRC